MTSVIHGVPQELDENAYALPFTADSNGVDDLAQWAVEHRDWVADTLLQHGAVLFRGFSITSEEQFQRASEPLCGPLLDYMYRSTPRTAVGHHVYTATEYRADASIVMHNENAFQRRWPMKLAFCCLQAAATGGETPLARTARVTARISPDVVRTFAEKGVMYVRNYGHGVDLPWQTTFQTSSKADVEAFCQREAIEWEWIGEDRLRTRQVCQGVARHPVTDALLWFNQAHAFHVSSLGREQQEAMLDLFGEADLPRNAYFGDGSRLEEAVLEQVRRAYEAEACSFPWQQGDVLLVDNMLVAHGRKSFTGSRRVLVAMGEPSPQVAHQHGRTSPGAPADRT